MEFLLLIIFIVLFYIGIKEAFRKDSIVLKKSNICPPHKWTYKNYGEENEYMVCSNCKMLPGGFYEEEERDGGID